MKNKTIFFITSSLILILAFLYINQNYLMADDREGKKDCSNMSECTDKNNEIKAGNQWNEYSFMTDQACCDEMKTELQSKLMDLNGVKEIKFSNTCSYSKSTEVKVYFDGSQTSEEVIAASVKEKNLSTGGNNCDKNGKHSGKDGMKECPHKQQSKETKI